MKTQHQPGWKGTFSYTYEQATQLADKWTLKFGIQYTVITVEPIGDGRENDCTWVLSC